MTTYEFYDNFIKQNIFLFVFFPAMLTAFVAAIGYLVQLRIEKRKLKSLRYPSISTFYYVIYGQISEIIISYTLLKHQCKLTSIFDIIEADTSDINIKSLRDKLQLQYKDINTTLDSPNYFFLSRKINRQILELKFHVQAVLTLYGMKKNEAYNQLKTDCPAIDFEQLSLSLKKVLKA